MKIILLFTTILLLGLTSSRGQETNQATTAQQRAEHMELVRSNMLRQAEIQRARVATNQTVLVSNQNSFVVAPEPSLNGLWLNTNAIATNDRAYRHLIRAHQRDGEKLAKRLELSGAPPDVISNAAFQETNFVMQVIEHIHASAQTNQNNPTNN